MKTHFTLDYVEEIDFSVLAINSHAKGYKLCWNINKELQLNFEKVEWVDFEMVEILLLIVVVVIFIPVSGAPSSSLSTPPWLKIADPKSVDILFIMNYSF